MILIEPSPRIFELERMLWNERLQACLGLQRRNFGGLVEDPFEIANKRWVDFCNKNGLEYIPKLLGY